MTAIKGTEVSKSISPNMGENVKEKGRHTLTSPKTSKTPCHFNAGQPKVLQWKQHKAWVIEHLFKQYNSCSLNESWTSWYEQILSRVMVKIDTRHTCDSGIIERSGRNLCDPFHDYFLANVCVKVGSVNGSSGIRVCTLSSLLQIVLPFVFPLCQCW